MATKKDLLGIMVSVEMKIQLLYQVADYLTQTITDRPLTIVTPNPEQIVYAQKDGYFRNLLNSADIALPDGVGLALASQISNFKFQISNKKQKYQIFKPIPGIEFMEELIMLAAEKGYGVGLVGGRNGVAAEALRRLQQKFTTLKGWAEDAPELEIKNEDLIINNFPEGDYFRNLVDTVKKNDTKLLFIGLGAPKQEYLIEQISGHFLLSAFPFPLVLMSVGGSFDELSGRIPRPPQWVSDLGLKWLWRLTLQPWRIWRQMALPKFIYLTITHAAD